MSPCPRLRSTLRHSDDRQRARRPRRVVAACLLCVFSGAALDLSATTTASAASCDVAPLPNAALQRAAAQLAEPSAPERQAAVWRLGALLPARLQVRRNDGVTLGIGEILATSGDASERSSALRSASWSVALTWELDRLWQPPPPPPHFEPLEHAERARRLFERLAALRARHALIRAEAGAVAGEAPRCAALQGEADAIDWALRATLRLPQPALMPGPTSPAPPPPLSRPPPPPAAPPARPPSAAR